MTDKVTFLFSADPVSLTCGLADFKKSATVEAEYGENVISGSAITLAHHGPRSANPAPCLRENEVVEGVDVIGFSHFDLDAFGGALSILGIKPDNSGFWNLAAFIDVNGPHMISKSGARGEDIDRLYAWWAYNKSNRFPRIPRDAVLKVKYEDIESWIIALNKIMDDDPEFLEAGKTFREDEKTLNEESYIDSSDGIVIRKAHSFVNHLYSTPEGDITKAVISFNEDTKAITLSLESPIEGLSCSEVMQKVFGPEAGGRAGIAGTPRNSAYNFEDVYKIVDVLKGFPGFVTISE